MPADDVSDLKDVFDAIDRLCETMRTSDCETLEDSPVESIVAEPTYVECGADLVSPEEVAVRVVNSHRAERWAEPPDDAETVTSDTEPVFAAAVSEMYYTASSEVSLLSDEAAPAPAQTDEDTRDRDDRKECVIAGHVAAMRERFESMTRTNTPCPDPAGLSPPLDVFTTPSP